MVRPWCWCLLVHVAATVAVQGQQLGEMQSRAVDTRVTLEILEGQPRGTVVGSIPIKPNFTYRFNEPPREFTLDSTTGEIRTTAVLDRESLRNDRYDLVVLSSQPTYPIEVRIVVLDVNDNAPEFPEPSIAVTFSESAAAGTRLLLDTASDRDSGTNGVSDDYRIVAGNRDDKFRLVVTANPSGEITYLHLETTGKLDRENRAFYQLNISARDGGDPPRYGYLQVNVTILDVNDNPPIFDHSDYIVSLNESVPPGTPVLQVMATDSDVGDNAKITYYLADTERQFGVDPETGVISTTETLDCPQQSCLQLSAKSTGGGVCPKSCVFTVFARDHGSPRQDGRTYVTVNLVDTNDHDPVIRFRYFPSTAGFATVDENAVNGSVVAAVSVVDLDEGLNGDTTVEIRAGNELGHFRLDYTPNFDIVRVNGVLDREEVNKYNLTVVATDKGQPPRTATAFLVIHVNDVNDHEPVFEKSEYSAVLSELAPPGTYVAGITATDEDTGVNAQIYYAFVSGNEHRWFEMDVDSGLITTSAPLDREVQDTVELRISARDGGPNPKWAYTQLKVTILDENDEKPVFSQERINVSLSESTPPDTLVAMLTASDHDQGTNGSVTYKLVENYPGVFALDSLTGQLTTRAVLDRETLPNYQVQVIARDQGVPPQSATATVFLSVLDVNDNSPEFYPQLYFASVTEDLPVGSTILQVKATDRDDTGNAQIRFALQEPGELRDIFYVNESTGVVTLKSSLKDSQSALFRLVITAIDGGDRKALQDAEVEIIKENRMDELEFESYSGYEFQIAEDYGDRAPSIGRWVGRVQVMPRDVGIDTTTLRYSIVYGDPHKSFRIDEGTGNITTASRIDREQVAVYSLTVIARRGLAYGRTTVNITVQDENDNAPVFSRDKDEVRLAENAAVGQEVYLARARDRDSGINSRVSYTLSYNPDEQFRIAESTGVIYLNRPIRAEPGSSMSVEVAATDAGEPSPLSSRHVVVVTIEDVNDHTPVFDHTSYETSLLESTPVNSRFFALAASDADLGPNGLVQYAITEGDADGKFGIFPDGYLYVKSALDRENRDYYSLTVTARDHGSPARSSLVPVVVHVIDENDNPPQFTNSTFTFHLHENEPPDSFVGKLTATDRDIGRNAELTFSLSNAQKDFAIDPKNGFIKTLHIFDREELVQSTSQSYVTLEATVTDNGVTRLRDKVKINVYVTDQNDNAPKFLRTPYKVQISEASPVGTQIFRVSTTDADEGLNGDVFYSIVSGNVEGRFAIDEATGQITVARVLDRETESRYILIVAAQDAGLNVRLSATSTVAVDLLDENDNAPEFTQTESRVSVLETTPINTRLVQFRASDADLGVNSEVTFSIGAGNRRDAFHMDPLTGTLFLHKALDYEELTSYTLNITASDGGNPRLSTTILFHVAVEDSNDNPPAFPNTAIVRQIREGIPVHTPIVTVAAEDPDSGPNGRVKYTISRQEPDDSRRHFGINPATGVIHTLLPIDRETVDTFRLLVVATDQALPENTRLSAEKLVTVIVEDINDNAPLFVSMSAAFLPRSGLHVMQVLARDLDSSTNGLVTYELVSGDTDLFRLHRSSGDLSLKTPIISPESRFHLAVKATDEAVQSERKSTEAYLTVIARGDGHASGLVFEGGGSGGLAGSVYENEPPGTSILTVRATGQPASKELEYYVMNVTGTQGRQVDRLFDMDMKLGILATAAQLDREAGSDTYTVEIAAIVANSPIPITASTTVRVTVLDRNDSPPSFHDTPLEYSVSEDLPIGQMVATLRATDPDTLGHLTYSLVSGDEGHFQLDTADTGVLRLREALDREARDTYRLQVRASDGVQHTDTTVTIKVTDTNDNPPVFSVGAYSFDVAENTGRGARVGSVTARDMDQGVNGQVSYSVVSDWANDVFSLNPQSGVFTLTSRLDYEEVQHYIFVVQAQDSGRPSLSSTLTVYFNVVDLNDNAPLFDPMSYSNEVFENVTVGTNVVTVSATDLDSGDNGRIVYSISAGDDDNDFSIAQNGTIYTTKLLDRETKSLYNLVVMATDQAKSTQQRLSSTVQVTIVLKDVNDLSPEFITPNETSVPENIPVNTVVMAVKALDRDEGRNSYIEYTLSATEPGLGSMFSLGPVDGLLRVSGRLDREIRANYTLEVTARDRGDPPRQTKEMILVRVLDENDNSPVFDPKQYSASVAENASIGASVLQVSATDVDEGANGRVRYAISSGDDNRDFSISDDTGVVRVAKNLNYERKSRYVLTVRAEDCAGGLLLLNSGEDSSFRFDTASIVITVADINDNPPTFLDSPYLAYVMENVVPPPNGYVLTVRAYDADTPPYNGQVRYFIKEGDADLFRINASSGEITLLRALDREAQADYVLTLVAMDTGTPPLTGSGTVHVVVQDVNDHSPEFEMQAYSASVRENMPPGTPVLQPTAVDRDADLNAKIRYSLLGDNVERFLVDADSGIITTAVELDREEVQGYHLTLVAQDSSVTEPRASAVNLTITVLDENDNAPHFSSERYIVHIPDHTQPGQFVFGAKAVDADEGINSRVDFSLGGEDAALFSIDCDTGVVKAAQELSGASGRGREFRMQLWARDGGRETKTATAELTVQLRPSGLFPSLTAPQETKFSLPENVAAGKVITQLGATSPKSRPAGKIRFAIAGGNVGDALRVDPTTGEVLVAGGGLDFETAPQYIVWVEARDSDVPPLRSVLQLVINVTDANDNAPIMENTMYNASIIEEEPPPQKVLQVQATDADSGTNGQLKYHLVNDENGAFEMNSETGDIFTNVRLDRESVSSYQLTVEAVDQGHPQLTGSATVVVTVLDKNDNPPRFTRLFSVNVTENAEPGACVIKVTSSDLDIGENANATYSFTENPGEKFSIDPTTGNVTVAGALDREAQDEYLLKVAAVDGAWRAETPLTITIQDQNDNAPEFEHSYYSFNFPELQRSVVFVGQVSATDRDKQGPNSVISYSLQHPSDLFTVDPASGELFSKRSLHYKHTALEPSPENQYVLTVMATDNGKPPMSSECLVTVNVVDANNNAPNFEQAEYFTPVPESAIAGQQIIQVIAKDEADFGVNAEVEYVKIGGNGSELFSVGKTTGWVSVITPSLAGRLLELYTLVVQAVDKGVPPQSDQAIVTLVITGENQHSPVFTALSYQVIVPENEPIGATIVTMTAADGDDGPNGIVRYSISSGNEREEFHVDAATGAITIHQPLDYDTVPEYRLNITASDLGFEPHHATAMLTVTLTDINDNAPVFNQTSYEAFLPENTPPHSTVYCVQAHDIDSTKNAIIQYSIVGGSGKDVFSIEPKTGIIFSKTSFDYEELNTYIVDILAANPDSPMYGSTKVVVHITGKNEFYPRFMQPVFHFDVSESAEVGTSVGIIQATDQDAGDDGIVFYLFVGSSNDRGFSIGSETGMIKVSRRLDRETQNRVVLTVMAKNAGGIRGNDTDEAQVIVSIQDGNDPPEFQQAVYDAVISEGASPGTKVITVKAVDKDVRPQNNQFSYSIIAGNQGHAFKVDPATGDVETTSQLDRETVPAYTLTLGAIDTGSPPQTGTTTIRIAVQDVNDNGPLFDPPEVIGYVMENEPPNTSVMTLSAMDPDLPPNGAPFTYRLVGGRQKDLVTVERQSGVVKTTRSIDREMTPQLDILVEVEDSGEPQMKSQHPVTVVVLDQNDSPSTPRAVHVLVHTFNDAFPVGKIADVRPNDADTSGEYHCNILSSTPPSRGILTIPTSCDLHTSKITLGSGYSLSVSGNDSRHPDVISTVTVEFISFDNSTVEHSVTLRLENMTASKFLTHFYKGLLDVLKSTFGAGDIVYLYSLHEGNGGLEVSIASRSPTGYRAKAQILDMLGRKRATIQQLLQSAAITVGYTPCQKLTCENGGQCSDGIRVHSETRITDSQTVVFASPLVSHDFMCHCTDGFTGKHCDRRQDPCSPNQCQAGGTCRRQGFDFQCVCPPLREGKLCEFERGDVCDGNPCLNGGSCRESPDGSSFFCLCRPGYRGNQCEASADSCRPNPCLHGGLCISLKPGYRCSCPEARYGRHCERSTFGFNELSFMTFPSLDGGTNDISMVFATTKLDALLVYNFGVQTGGRSDFVALELVAGRAVFSYGGARTAITSVRVDSDSLADGEWHKVTATRNGRVVSLSVASCTEHGDVCTECRPGDASCYADEIGPAGTLNFNNQPMWVGGLASADAILERPGQIHSDDLVGCVHGVSVNGRALNLSNPLRSWEVDSTCGRSGRSPCSAPENTVSDMAPCGPMGSCLDQWKTVACVCHRSGIRSSGHLVAPDCRESLQPISLGEGAFLEYRVSDKHRRMQLLELMYKGSTLWREEGVLGKGKEDTQSSSPAKSLSVVFRTVQEDGLLVYTATNNDFTSLELRGGQLMYVSRLGAARTPVNMTVVPPSGSSNSGGLADGNWHNVTLTSHNHGLRLLLDGVRVGDELDLAGVHDFLDPYLTAVFLGGVTREMFAIQDSAPVLFEGCFANFSINNEVQPFNGSGSIFSEVLQHGKIGMGCSGPVGGVSAAAAPDPLSIGITLVIVFFIILLVAILVSFVVFRLRRQKKEKGDGPGGSPGAAKQNGSMTLVAGGGVGVSSGGGDSREGPPSFLSETNDVLRGGHHLVAPELISKKYKEREIIGTEMRPQRPDIIEREVVSKSLPQHPPLPPPSSTSQNQGQPHHPHEQPQPSSGAVDLEVPEHYDLENASSIAPSDIDIVYHYKGYREGGNVRKYKATPPHLPPSAGGNGGGGGGGGGGGPVSSYHHKHQTSAQQQQHRHSPHHFPPGTRSVVPPPPASRVDSPPSTGAGGTSSGGGKLLQSTPLARLSPSSELSAQQTPRILTLQDISGKPLQSALLATTSSSGGKDASERSLNSPVMSQLSGQSSAASRKAGPVGGAGAGDGGSGGTVGLTAEEIERLNSRPRTSSLVSTLDAVSSSSEAPRGRRLLESGAGPPPPVVHHLNHLHHSATGADPHLDNHSSTTTDESGNDSFTCSEFEYDNNTTSENTNNAKRGEAIFGASGKLPLAEAEDEERRGAESGGGTGNGNKPPIPPVPTSYDGFDSSFRGSLSTLVASDDDLSTHMGAPIYRPHNGSPSAGAALGWDYLLNWGPNFESLVGVFKDIAELPDSVNSRVAASLRLPNSASKPSEEYV